GAAVPGADVLVPGAAGVGRLPPAAAVEGDLTPARGRPGEGRAAGCSPGARRPSSGGSAAVAAPEPLDAPGGVHHAPLPGVEGVAGAGDLHVDDRVAAAVLPGDALVGGGGRAGQEGEVARLVAEDHRLVLGVDALLHAASSLGGRPAAPGRGSVSRRLSVPYKRTTIVFIPTALRSRRALGK